MKLDLHNHTARCKHAEGTMESYIVRAIECGIELYGFADHAPMFWDDAYRMRPDEMDDYEAEFAALKERFDGQIKLLLGYEMDYLPGKMDERVLGRNVDFRIGSVHFLGTWAFDNPALLGDFGKHDLDESWNAYFAAMRDMAASKQFDIAGHFDLIKLFGHYAHKGVDHAVREALEAIKQTGMAIEINTSGWRRTVGEQYPSRAILEAACELQIPLTFGSDAHALSHVGANLDRAYELARAIGYKNAAYFERRELHLVKI